MKSSDIALPPSKVQTIVLRLARNPDAHKLPRRDQGYVITAPLYPDGRLAIAKRTPNRWPVRRFGDEGDGETGWLAHSGSAWFIDYDEDTAADDEAIFRLSDHRFVVGEYLTVTNKTGQALTYQISDIEPLD